MRNLELLLSASVGDFPDLVGCQRLSVDYDTGWIYITTKESTIICLDPHQQQILWNLSLIEEGYSYLEASDHAVVGLQHLPDQQSVCVATTKGDVLLYATISRQLECVGSVESGLTSMTWSPDHELVILSTGANTLLLMTKDFDPIVETALHPQEFGEQEPITLGWGKKETQFHGAVGKEAATRQADDMKPALAWDDMGVRVSWRGDGQFFAISVISPESGVRRLRIWSRDCILQCTSEDLSGLGQPLCWKPSGSLIASSQHLDDCLDIVFFEKNGLRHGEFSLPFHDKAVWVCEILWNIESTVMAIWLEDLMLDDLENKTTARSYVQLWTVSNYHWYLKQSLDFPPCDRLVAVLWDPEQAYRLHVLTQSGRYLTYLWAWATNHSCGTDGDNDDDDAVVAVIDGDKLLMTPFRKMVVPPPMSAYCIKLPGPVSQVCFAPPPHSNKMAALMNDGRVAVYTSRTGDCGSLDDLDPTVELVAAGGVGFKSMMQPPSLLGVMCIETTSGQALVFDHPAEYRHLVWVDDANLVIISSDPRGSTLRYLHLEEEEPKKPRLMVQSQTAVVGEVYRVCRHPTTGVVALQLRDGSVVTPDNEAIVKLPQSCTQMEMCRMGGQAVVLGLTERYRFYINDVEFASNCTSFAVHNDHLLLTTHSHTCRCVSLSSRLGDIQSLDETVRRVERGARIVVAIPNDTRLVLQLPRGNLETVHPRPLVLAAVRKLLDGVSYQEAFIVMKRHRLDWNLFYDHNPEVFLENVDQFVEQLDSATSLNLVLTNLKAEDTTRTLYSLAYEGRPAETAGEKTKIDIVCDAVRESLLRTNHDKFFLSILTTHVKKTQPEVEDALERIRGLSGADSSPDRPSIDKALKYLILLVDVNELYDVALGTYDFNLVLMVAEKSQKDPKEYLPFLNDLRKMDPDYQRYLIDKHLRRYTKALGHISRCQEEERFVECINLVKENNLYSQALELFERGSERYKAVATEYCKYLASKNRYAEAALVYTLSDQWELALEMNRKCGQWQQAYSIAARLDYTEERLAGMTRSLAVYLVEHRRHSEAAGILLEYANDVEEAIGVLISGNRWQDSLRLMYKHKREDIAETHLKPAIAENCECIVSSLDNLTSTFNQHRQRLAAVREEKHRQDQLDEQDDDAGGDLYSDTSSALGSITSYGCSTSSALSSSTVNSKMSGRSRKNRRKAEFKKRSLRPGSKHEDLALLQALADIVRNVDELKGDVGNLLPALLIFDYKKEAQKLQTTLQDTLKTLAGGIASIWAVSTVPQDESKQGFGVQFTSNLLASSMNVQGPGSFPMLTAQSLEDVALFIPPKLSRDDKWKLHLLDPR